MIKCWIAFESDDKAVRAYYGIRASDYFDARARADALFRQLSSSGIAGVYQLEIDGSKIWTRVIGPGQAVATGIQLAGP